VPSPRRAVATPGQSTLGALLFSLILFAILVALIAVLYVVLSAPAGATAQKLRSLLRIREPAELGSYGGS